MHVEWDQVETKAANSKYTCRYEIQITDDEFQAGKKIIGVKGQNMKGIIEKCADKS